MMKAGWACCVIRVVCLMESSAQAQPGSTPALEVPNTPQLFLDDHLIAKSQGLRRDMETPVRHPRNPLIIQDRPWEARMLSVYGTVLYDERSGKFRCWYLASEGDRGVPDTPEAPGTAEYFQCYAESDDGIQWTKPDVGSKPCGRHRRHNIVVPDAHGFCVLHTPGDPDLQRQYKGLGGNVVGFSPDGIVWSLKTDVAKNWAAAIRKNDTSSCVVRRQGEYLAYVRYQEPETCVKDPASGIEWRGVMRGVGISISKDFNTWTPKRPVFKTDATDGYPWTQPYGLCVTPYGNALIGLVPMLHLAREQANNSYGTMDVQMLVSRDGRTWSRVADRAVFMKHGGDAPVDKRPWDAHVYPSTTMVVKDDQVYIYYTGSNLIHGERRRVQNVQPKCGIGLATLPADRFAALQPTSGDVEGIVQTHPLRIHGRRLLVNAQVGPNDLQVEVCTAEGCVIPGFERNRCRLTPHDKLRHEANWQTDERLKALQDSIPGARTVVLRFFIRKGALYAFQTVG